MFQDDNKDPFWGNSLFAGMRGRLMGIMDIIRQHWDFRLSPML
jgi:hypothetical protein